MLDPGHGGTDPGAIGNGLLEKDLNLKIAKATKEYLDTRYSGHTTQLTRSGDTTMALVERTNKANRWGADYLLSIHINAGGGTGYEDFIFNGSVQPSTARLRDIIHSEVSKAAGWRNRGKKTANFHVLRESKMSAMLTENGFIDNKQDADKLKQNSTIQEIAKAHTEGLAKALKLKKKTTSKSPGKMYKVQIGAFTVKANAEKRAAAARKAGFDTYILEE